jgi:tetratricopeptide (TPR) repeat protein
VARAFDRAAITNTLGAPSFAFFAAISHGSSGGGLFDSNGNLIGITTFTIENSQQLNFAMPAEDIAGLQRQPKEVTAAAWTAIGDQTMDEAGRQFYSMGPPPIGDPKAMQKWGEEFDVVPLLALWRRASHSYEEAVRIDQKNWQTWLKLAKAYSLFDENKAGNVLNRVTTISPGDVSLWIGVAKIQSTMNEDAAIDAYNHALAITPNDPSILLEVARSYARSDPRKSLQILGGIEALHPSDPFVWWNVGLQYLIAGKNKLAEAAYQQAIALDGKRPEFLLSLGQLYAVEGKRSKLSDVYTRLKALDPSTAAVLAKSAP